MTFWRWFVGLPFSSLLWEFVDIAICGEIECNALTMGAVICFNSTQCVYSQWANGVRIVYGQNSTVTNKLNLSVRWWLNCNLWWDIAQRRNILTNILFFISLQWPAREQHYYHLRVGLAALAETQNTVSIKKSCEFLYKML